MRIIRAIALIFTSILFYQCQKEISHTNTGITPTPNLVNPEPVSARLQGNVFDENGHPAAGVTVKVGSETVVTDSRGYFRMMNASLDKKSSLVTAEKAGYFKAYRTFAATSGTNQVVIKLIKKNLAGTINATTGGSVTLSNGTKVELPANGVVKAADNSSYSGTVNVYVAYIDPTSHDISQIVPGSFMANDATGSRVTLASYGMVAVELESSSSERLQIKNGSKAILTTPIPAAVMGTAPQTIPLWSVNEQTGIWEEEGSATKQGNVYVGEVAHFSFWNCDVPMNAVVLSMTVVDQNGNPVIYANVKLSEQQNPYSAGYGFTDSLGQVSGFVPANSVLVMEVKDICGNTIYTQNVGPFSQNTNLGTVTITPSTTNVLTITGQLNDCGGAPVTNGYAIVNLGGWIRYVGVDASGVFSTDYFVCTSTPTTVELLPVDNGALVQGSITSVNTTAPITNVGTLTACGTSAVQYINYEIDGVPHSYGYAAGDSLVAYTSPQQGTSQFYTMFGAADNSGAGGGGIVLSFFSPSVAPGTYQVLDLGLGGTGGGSVALVQPFNVVITNFPQNVGEFYEGTFSGNYTVNSVTHTITNGSFRFRRSY